MTDSTHATPDLDAIRARLEMFRNGPEYSSDKWQTQGDVFQYETAPDDIAALLTLHDRDEARLHKYEVALVSNGDKLREALKRNAELTRDVDGYRDYADTLSKGLADLRDTALTITADNVGGVAGDPEEVILEAKAQLIAAKARIEALEDALRDIAYNPPPSVPEDHLDSVLVTLAGVRRVARRALGGNK
jgi:hypothetical protein